MSDHLEARIEATARLLRAAVRESGAFLSGDDRVDEAVAARLIGWAPGTLRNRRNEGSGPPFYRLGGQGHAATYRLQELAAWIERARLGDEFRCTTSHEPARRCTNPHDSGLLSASAAATIAGIETLCAKPR